MEFLREEGRIYALSPEGELLCEVRFPARDGVAAISRTFVHPSLRGQGVAGRLMEEAVAAIRSAGWKARPLCSYAAGWFQRHPEHADLLLN